MRTPQFFLDTSGWMAFIDEDEPAHPRANEVRSQLGRVRATVFITDWVVAETGNGVARRSVRGRFVESFRRYQQMPQAQLVTINEDRLERAVALYEARQDKAWGLVDCASFIVMDEWDIRDALTADRHFEQAGFRCLLGG